MRKTLSYPKKKRKLLKRLFCEFKVVKNISKLNITGEKEGI